MPNINPNGRPPRLPPQPPPPPIQFENRTPESFGRNGFVNTTPAAATANPHQAPVNPNFINTTPRDHQGPIEQLPPRPPRPELSVDTSVGGGSPAGQGSASHHGDTTISAYSVESGRRAPMHPGLGGSSTDSSAYPGSHSPSSLSQRESPLDSFRDRPPPPLSTPSLSSPGSSATYSVLHTPRSDMSDGARVFDENSPSHLISRSPSFEIPDSPTFVPNMPGPLPWRPGAGSRSTAPSPSPNPSASTSTSSESTPIAESSRSRRSPTPGPYDAPTPGAWEPPPTPGANYGTPSPGGYVSPAAYRSPTPYDSNPPTPGFAPTPGVYGQSPSPGGYGYAPTPGAYNQSPSPGGYGYAPTPGAYGQSPSPGGYGYAPTPGAYNQSPSPGGYGYAPTPQAYRSPTPGSGAPTPGGYLSPTPGAEAAADALLRLHSSDPSALPSHAPTPRASGSGSTTPRALDAPTPGAPGSP